MAFTFRRYGTFTGPGVDIDYRDNDDFSLDPFEGYFNLPDDVSMVLANTTDSPIDYVYMHLDGFNTNTVTLERNNGNIPTFNINANIVNFSDDVFVDKDLDVNGVLSATNLFWGGRSLNSAASTWDAKKGFDIPHPTKDNHRLRYICVEGPSAEVYLRGKLKDETTINLPDYWKDLVDIETIGVTLTPIGHYQELFVDKIEWGTRIVVKNNAGSGINCSYVVFAERKDTTKNIPEYQGLTPADYPGDNKEYVINGKTFT
jgi:hypothetical protein